MEEATPSGRVQALERTKTVKTSPPLHQWARIRHDGVHCEDRIRDRSAECLFRHYTLKLQRKSLSQSIHRRISHDGDSRTSRGQTVDRESVSLSHRVRVTTIKNLVFSGEGWITGESVHKPLLEVLNGKRQSCAASLDDAPGGALSAGVHGGPQKCRRRARFMFCAEACRRGDAATDPSVRFRRGDFVFGHSGHPARARSQRSLRSRRRSAARTARRSRRDGGATRHDRRRRAGADLRNDPARQSRTASGRDVSRLLRRALDGCDLHGRRPRHAGSGAGAAIRLSSSRGVRAPDRHPGRGVKRLSRSPAQRRCRRCANLRYLGRNSAA